MAHRAVLLGALALTACDRVFGVNLEDAAPALTWTSDDDGDGWNAQHMGPQIPDALVVAARDGDCHDDNPAAFPGSTAPEVPLDGVDTDCDGNDYCTDLNCDGLPDVTVPGHYDGDYDVNQPARLLSAVDRWRLESAAVRTPGTTGQVVLDLDRDGYPDIVHASIHGVASFATDSYIYWGRTGHTEADRTALPTTGALWVCAADLDRNGWTDLVFADQRTDAGYTATSYVYWNRQGLFSPLDRLELPTVGVAACAIDDLDADGELDIVFAGYIGETTYAASSLIYWGSPSHDYPVMTRTALPTTGTYSVSIADLDGDDRLDLVFWAQYDGASYVTSNNAIYWNRGDRFATVDRTSLPGMGGLRGAVADLDRDGHPEIIVAGYFSGAWTSPATTYIYWGNAEHAYGPANSTPLAAWGVQEAIVDDVNGDGHLDVLLPSYWDGDSATRLTIFWGSASGMYSSGASLELPSNSSLFGTAVLDFDHDGYKDVFVPGYHNNITGTDAAPWSNLSYSRIFWGSTRGLSPTMFSEWPTRGAWYPRVVGR